MMKTVELNGRPYRIQGHECPQQHIEEFCNLKIYPDLAKAERLVGLLCDIAAEVFGSAAAALEVHGWRLGGFIPLECARRGVPTRVFGCPGVTEILFPIPHKLEIGRTYSPFSAASPNILFLEEGFHLSPTAWPTECFVLAASGVAAVALTRHQPFPLEGSPYTLYVPVTLATPFQAAFGHYITPQQQLAYDNLIHLVIMVKNAGTGFEEVLKKTAPHIDRWTILDTGSTDGTQEVVRRVLGAAKPGNLYEEPFVNFRESRNRSLELAGSGGGSLCKFTLILDDTYWVDGPLRAFLQTVRGDQYATSYSTMIISGDSEYYSNRIIKTEAGLRYIYTIHEVIQFEGNTNVVIPKEHGRLVDECSGYMEQRTKDRKRRDIELLEGMLKEDPDNPRHLYYLAQTYKCLEDWPAAEEYFRRRIEFPREGFLQEKVDACFELARLMNFQLDRPWEACKAMYERAFALEPSRPDPLYFIGVHYYLEGAPTSRRTAFEYFKRAIALGYPVHTQYSLKPTLFFHFLPKFLTQLCYEFEEYELGLATADLFLKNNGPAADSYELIANWRAIFEKLCASLTAQANLKIPGSLSPPAKPRVALIADGGWGPWTGRDILTKGVGGSETYIIEIARGLQAAHHFDVTVFCNCTAAEVFEGVQYTPLKDVWLMLAAAPFEYCLVSRFSEYVPACISLPNVKRVGLILHDLGPSGNILPMHAKLESVFCLTEWHRRHFLETFPQFADRTHVHGYGIDMARFEGKMVSAKPHAALAIAPRFIYSSFPNRGLLPLLQMWPKIQAVFPAAELHIYADLSGAWVNRVAGEQIQEIRRLLAAAAPQRIYEHGWVNKEALAAAWKAADVWFYPCTFKETFCLTAVEAAASRTLVVSNALAALENTVGNRGLQIPGDPMDPAWQATAVAALIALLRDPVAARGFIEANYAWAAARPWSVAAAEFEAKYLLRPEAILNVAGMYNWLHDLPTGSRHLFEEAFAVAVAGRPQPQILEIGVYAGTSLLSLLSRAGASAHATAIDRWEDYDEFGNPVLGEMKSRGIEQTFYDNVGAAGAQDRVTALKGDSVERLLDLVRQGKSYDFIYVDGSHKCIDCYTDMALAWRLLRRGGVMAVDDYLFKVDVAQGGQPLAAPFYGVEHFLEKYGGKYTLLSKEYRVFLQKI
jgi:predicted O-methyltransferase YrrM/glycosyltransferase involved in cell wall biosynthesis